MATDSPRSLLAHLAHVPDPRDPKGCRFSHVALLAAACAAILCGAKSFEAIAQWARLQDLALMHRLGFTRTPPTAGAYRYLFLLLDGVSLQPYGGIQRTAVSQQHLFRAQERRSQQQQSREEEVECRDTHRCLAYRGCATEQRRNSAVAVGYGNIAPRGLGANTVTALEALTGVLGFAVATGLLFGRVSRPSARIGFSENVLVTPYQDTTSLQFRVVNRRQNSLMELEARVMLMTVEMQDGVGKRRYQLLRLEREKVIFFPLTWTVVHPIDENSPLFGFTADDMSRADAELYVLIIGFDEVYSSFVLRRTSYTYQEIQFDVKFVPMYRESEAGGTTILEMQKLNLIKAVK